MSRFTLAALRRTTRDFRAGRVALPSRPVPAVRIAGKLSLFNKQAACA